jgi:hypothetical protein
MYGFVQQSAAPVFCARVRFFCARGVWFRRTFRPRVFLFVTKWAASAKRKAAEFCVVERRGASGAGTVGGSAALTRIGVCLYTILIPSPGHLCDVLDTRGLAKLERNAAGAERHGRSVVTIVYTILVPSPGHFCDVLKTRGLAKLEWKAAGAKRKAMLDLKPKSERILRNFLG